MKNAFLSNDETTYSLTINRKLSKQPNPRDF